MWPRNSWHTEKAWIVSKKHLSVWSWETFWSLQINYFIWTICKGHQSLWTASMNVTWGWLVITLALRHYSEHSISIFSSKNMHEFLRNSCSFRQTIYSNSHAWKTDTSDMKYAVTPVLLTSEWWRTCPVKILSSQLTVSSHWNSQLVNFEDI